MINMSQHRHDVLRSRATALAQSLTASGAVYGGTALQDRTDVPDPTGPPTRSGNTELKAPWQLARLIRAAPHLLWAPRGDGRIVVDVPGWKASDRANSPLRGYLRHLGYDARGWGLGTNRGRPEQDALRLGESIVALSTSTGKPITLLGWSLGGLIAREVARNHPEHVSQVITYGTPVVAGPSHTLAASVFGRAECERIATLQIQLDTENPITTPITAIFTRTDAVVSWQACIDKTSPNVEHVEVRSSHLGLGLDPDVWHVVARRLAADTARS